MIKHAVRNAVAVIVASALVVPTIAAAAETRSASSLPTKKALARSKAPVRGTRSNLAQWVPILAVVGGVTVVVGWQLIDDGNDSPG